ncbi:MAG: Fic family protein [Candidatus Nanopelagicales bacterium]|nr:Fic family protein [Candidatus Nanopelagicales bacterium]MDZ4249762.1 Fic family protein [Candidatus Nanopelagicales bacterium]
MDATTRHHPRNGVSPTASAVAAVSDKRTSNPSETPVATGASFKNGRVFKPLKEYLEVRGYADAAQWVYAQAVDPGDWHTDGLVSLAEIRQVHEVAMTPVWQVAPHPDATEREAPGHFREHDIHQFEGGMTPPSWPLVPARMRGWVDQVNSSASELAAPVDHRLPEVLARLHTEFEEVHPFIDGNGRTGRLLLNLLLVRLGYPPIIVLKKQRDTYLAALTKADYGYLVLRSWGGDTILSLVSLG